jgi:hypothetical protein
MHKGGVNNLAIAWLRNPATMLSELADLAAQRKSGFTLTSA